MKLIDSSDLFQPTGMATASLCLSHQSDEGEQPLSSGVHLKAPLEKEDVFAYIRRMCGDFNLTLYRQIVGAANEFKEGDLTVGVAAANETSRSHARALLECTTLGDLRAHSLYTDGIYQLIAESTETMHHIESMTLFDLKSFVLSRPEDEIKLIMPGLTSDVVACLVKIMSNDELIQCGQKIFNSLPGSNIGAKGYMSARIQPNSPTDNTDDIMWQVFDGFSYAVGDVVLGTNPVSSEPSSVAKIAATLSDVISTFGLQGTLPHCVLAHIDVQAEAQAQQPPSSSQATSMTGIWFQSLAGTVGANQTFDVTIEKMKDHAANRPGKYGLYGETGQGADFTNGHAQGFDMVVHESRKYGFLRALQQGLDASQWVHVNDGTCICACIGIVFTQFVRWLFSRVNQLWFCCIFLVVAGFIGPEVFKTKEQLVRCCLEDTVMGKLHGLTIGLDICSTLHMDVTLDDLNWCIDNVMVGVRV